MKKKFRIQPIPSKTLSWWYSKKNQIDMSPPYQRRGRLWSPADKGYLIDSIINEYDIPKIYMADFTWGDSPLNYSKLSYAIIDGKQRFEAIFDFFEGNIVLNDDFVYLNNPKLELGGLGYKDLKNNYNYIAEEFENYNLTVMGVHAEDNDPINELFVRLNRSKALTGAEVRNAMAGPAPELIREIANHDFFLTNIYFQVKRGQDLNAAAKLLIFEYHNSFYDTTKSSLDEFVKDLQQPNDNKKAKLELAGRRIFDNLDEMSTIFLPNDKLLNSSGMLPVYYMFIRTLKEEDYSKVREFLNNFEKEKSQNRSLVKNNPESKEIDSALVSFDNYNRSTNNLQSHVERFKILVNRFDIYKEKYQKRKKTKFTLKS